MCWQTKMFTFSIEAGTGSSLIQNGGGWLQRGAAHTSAVLYTITCLKGSVRRKIPHKHRHKWWVTFQKLKLWSLKWSCAGSLLENNSFQMCESTWLSCFVITTCAITTESLIITILIKKNVNRGEISRLELEWENKTSFVTLQGGFCSMNETYDRCIRLVKCSFYSFQLISIWNKNIIEISVVVRWCRIRFAA